MMVPENGTARSFEGPYFLTTGEQRDRSLWN
jgi:hypothetical protein